MTNKQFAERLNKELDSMGVPPRQEERIEVFAHLLDIRKFKAESLLNGHVLPDDAVLELLSHELEVDALWLLGKTNVRHRKKDS